MNYYSYINNIAPENNYVKIFMNIYSYLLEKNTKIFKIYSEVKNEKF